MKLLTPDQIRSILTKYADNDEIVELCDNLVILLAVLDDMDAQVEIIEEIPLSPEEKEELN